MATTLLERLLDPILTSPRSLHGVTPDTQNSDNSFPSVNDSFKNGTYHDTWEKEMGSGKMEMIEIERPTLIKIKLDFSVPMEAHNIAEYKIIKENDSIKVSWIMYGKNNFISKIFSTFIDEIVKGVYTKRTTVFGYRLFRYFPLLSRPL
jgi:hypothetical protein